MEVIRGHRHVAARWPGAAVAIGNFDGVHVGHRALLSRARELATGELRTVALTFDPHPSAVLSPSGAPPMVTSLARRIELLEAAGADAVVIEPFTREFSAFGPEAFVDDVLIGALRARAIVVGYDFSYGQHRAGTIDTLRARGAGAGIEIAIVPAVEIAGVVASSTKIRAALRAGELATAERLLDRPWDIDGTVIHGAKRGRAIGVPTANIKPESELLLRGGIYAVTLGVEGNDGAYSAFPAVASLGTNPTFVEGGGLVLEVHVLDFVGDLYDQRVRTTFVARLRDEEKFDSIDALKAQIDRDIEAARLALAKT